MAVNVKKVEDQKYVELHKFERYVADVFGKGPALYQRGYAYPVNAEQLEALLSHECDGECPFRLHKPAKVVRQVVSEDRVRSPVAPIPNSIKVDEASAAAAKANRIPDAPGKRIDVSDPDLEAEIAARTEGLEEI